MASECKLCILLGATICCTVENDESVKAHADLHARQLHLIEFENQGSVPTGSDSSTTARNNGQIPTEGKSTKTVLFTFCRELVDSHGENCDIKCSQCKICIKSNPNKTNAANRLINHACVHLNKDLYSCAHCDFKFVTKGGMCSHLFNVHAISSKSENYVDMTEDHQNDIMDMVKLCFGKAPDKKFDITMFEKRKRFNYQRRDPLLNLAYDIVLKHQRDHIQCHLCPRSIPSKQNGVAASTILDHVRWHVDKPCFTCRLCQYSASTERTVRAHLLQVHSVAKSQQNYNNMSSEYSDEISTMLGDCFDETRTDRPPELTKEQVQTRRTKNQLRKRFAPNSLLVERKLRCAELAQKFHRSGNLECRKCHQQLNVVDDKKTKYISGPMQHAVCHFNKLLFTCRQCTYKCMTKGMIHYHVRTKHGIPSSNQFDDSTDDLHSDFMDLLSNCFDWDLEPSTSSAGFPTSTSQVSGGSQKSKLAIISWANGNVLKAARYVLAHDLIRKHGKEGKMICRLCGHHAHTQTGASRNLFNHALPHLDAHSWPYRCKLCSHITANRHQIHSHLRKMHKGKSVTEFEDMSDIFHKDIMKIISRCYDWRSEQKDTS